MSRTTITKTFSLPPDVAHALKDRADIQQLPESLIVRWALEKYLTDTQKTQSRRAARKEPKS